MAPQLDHQPNAHDSTQPACATGPGSVGVASVPDEAGAQRRIWLLETLHAVSHMIAAIDDIDAHLQAVAEEIRARFRVTAVGIGVATPERLLFRGLATNHHPQVDWIPIDVGICGRVMRTGVGELVTEVTHDPDYYKGSDHPERAVVIPIMIDGVAWGVLNVEADADTVLDAEIYDVLSTLTTSIRLSVSRSRQREAEQRRLRQLDGVQRVADLIERGLSRGPDEPDVCTAIATYLDYTEVAIGVIVDEHQLLHGYIAYSDYLQDAPPHVVIDTPRGVIGRVLVTGEPAFVRDVTQDSDFRRIHATTNQEICIPIRSGSKLIGIINAELDDRREIDDTDLTILLTIADHLGSAINNHLRIRDLEVRTEQLRRVEEVTRQIAGMLDIRDSLPDIVQQLEHMFAYSTTGIGLLRGGRLLVSAFYGDTASTPISIIREGLPIDRGITGRVARTGRAELVVNVTNDPDYVDATSGSYYEACAPIVNSSGVVGILNVETTIARPLNAGDLEIVSIVAGHIGLALEKLDLYTAERRSRVALEAMQRVSNIVASALVPNEALQVMAATLADAFGYPYVQISLLEADDVRPAASVGGSGGTPDAGVPLGEGIIGRIAETGIASYVRHTSEDPSLVGALADMSSAIAVPIRHAGRIIGVLNVEGTYWRNLEFDDLHLLQTFAEHAGTILHNAQVYARMEWLATRDPLTNLPNYREFRNRFREALAHAQRHDTPVSLLVIDLDAFKTINDRYGHLAGDEALRTIARRLSSELRAEDILARYAGDEFVAILPNTERVVAESVAARLTSVVSATPIALDGHEVSLSLSLGVATWPDNGATPDVLIDHADELMYQVKRTSGAAATASAMSASPPSPSPSP